MPASTLIRFDTTAPTVSVGNVVRIGSDVHIAYTVDEPATIDVTASIEGFESGVAGIDLLGPWIESTSESLVAGVDEIGPWIESTSLSPIAGVDSIGPWIDNVASDDLLVVVDPDVFIVNDVPVGAHHLVLFITATDDVDNSAVQIVTVPLEIVQYDLPLTLTFEPYEPRMLTVDPAPRTITIDPASRVLAMEYNPHTLSIENTPKSLSIESTDQRLLMMSATQTRLVVLDPGIFRSLYLEEK